MTEKELMTKFLESWCELELLKRGRILPLCINMPNDYYLLDNWNRFWGQIDTNFIVSIADNSSSLEETALARMFFIHEFLNWLYE